MIGPGRLPFRVGADAQALAGALVVFEVMGQAQTRLQAGLGVFGKTPRVPREQVLSVTVQIIVSCGGRDEIVVAITDLEQPLPWLPAHPRPNVVVQAGKRDQIGQGGLLGSLLQIAELVDTTTSCRPRTQSAMSGPNPGRFPGRCPWECSEYSSQPIPVPTRNTELSVAGQVETQVQPAAQDAVAFAGKLRAVDVVVVPARRRKRPRNPPPAPETSDLSPSSRRVLRGRQRAINGQAADEGLLRARAAARDQGRRQQAAQTTSQPSQAHGLSAATFAGFFCGGFRPRGRARIGVAWASHVNKKCAPPNRAGSSPSVAS